MGLFLIVGATSGIARALCHQLAGRGHRLVLAGRDQDDVRAVAADLVLRYGGDAIPITFDAVHPTESTTLVSRAEEAAAGLLQGVVVCHGTLAPEAGPASSEAIEHLYRVNLLSVAVILERAAEVLAPRRDGMIVAISSVAGDRGRQSNYLYGSSKAALTALLSGLRNRMHPHGVAVVTVKPGFVDTRMLDGKRRPPAFLVASPERVARSIVRAMERRRNVVYAPWYWRLIMAVINLVPEAIFKRLKL